MRKIFLLLCVFATVNLHGQNVKIYTLKNEYELHKVITSDSIFFNVKKDNLIINVSKEYYNGDISDKFYKNYSNVDFNDYFLLTKGGGNWISYCYLISKKQHKMLFQDREYILGCFDTNSDLLMVFDINNFNNAVLFDLKNDTFANIDISTVVKDKYPPVNYYTLFQIKSTNSEVIVVKYQGFKKVLLRIKRKDLTPIVNNQTRIKTIRQ